MGTWVNKEIVLVGIETVYDPQDGLQLVQTWRGSERACQGTAAQFMAMGYKVRVGQEGGRSTVTVYLGGTLLDGQPEAPVDNFKIAKDYIQVSIYESPNIIPYIQAYATSLAVQYDEAVATIRTVVEAALKGRKFIVAEGEYQDFTEGPIPPSQTGFTADGIVDRIYRLLLRKTEAFEDLRPVLTRVRSYSANFATRVQMPVVPKIWPTASFITAFNIPAVIQAQLPAVPSQVPQDSAWAWKERIHESTTDWYGRIVETTQWTYAAWSTLLYDLQS